MKDIHRLFLLFCIIMISFSAQAQYGLIDNDGKIILPFEYGQYWSYKDGYITLKKGEKVGMVDLQGKQIIPFEYEALSPFTEKLASAKKDGKVGYINKKGKVVIPFQYINAREFNEGLAIVTLKEGRQYIRGLINKKGKVVVPIEYNQMTRQEDGTYHTFKNNMYSVLDAKGKEIIPGLYSSLLRPERGDHIYTAVLKGKTGYLDQNGKELIPFIYDRGGRFTNGFVIATKDKKNVLIDKTGKIIPTPADCKLINGPYEDMIVFSEGDKKGYLGTDGKVIIPATYTTAGVFNNDFASVANEQKKRGLINKKGETVAPFIYEYIGYLSNGYAYAKKDGKVGLIDKTGKVVLPFTYDEIRNFDNGFAVTRKGETYGLIDSTLKVIAPAIYDTYVYIKANTNRIWMKKDGKMGCIDFRGKQVIPFVFDEARLFEEGLSICKTNDPKAAAVAIKNNDGIAPAAAPVIGLDLQFVSKKTTGSRISLSYRLVNKSKEDVLILKAQNSIPEFGVNPEIETVNPEFFSPELAMGVRCEYAPMFQDNGAEDSRPKIPFKQASDFITIAGGQSIDFSINFDNYKKAICAKDISEFKFQLVYQFDKRYLDTNYFNHRAKEAQLSTSESRAIYKLLQQCYKGKIVSDEIRISME